MTFLLSTIVGSLSTHSWNRTHNQGSKEQKINSVQMNSKKNDTYSNHLVHDIMYRCFNDQGLLASICINKKPLSRP